MTATSDSTTTTTTLVNQVFIKADPQKVWDAITDPKWNERYGYKCASEYDLRPGGSYRTLSSKAMLEHGAPEVLIKGEVIESDPPRKLVHTWHGDFGPDMSAEPATRLTYEIDEIAPGVSKLTVIHETEGAPNTLFTVSGQHPEAGGGWYWILSDLKTLLETGESIER
jgi:uncharacterized protein YndB with AHSA1/START domain